MRIILTVLLLCMCVLGQAQECKVLTPEVRTMGLPSHKHQASVNLDEVEPVTIPVVFHIVHKGQDHESNITDEQVISQIAALDTGFSLGAGVDTKITFCLASRDPQGNPTNGITRTDGVAAFGSAFESNGVASSSIEDGMSDLAMKTGSGCWDPDRYVNFYVVPEINGNNAGGGVQGYAYLGPTGDCRDGIVQLYNVTGTTGDLKPGRDQGKTGVHEMGHHLSLYHTFSNSSNCVESNCTTQGDLVCDTPPTTQNIGCFASSCPDAMLENFMDYTSQDCKYSFSVGQAERMHSQLQTLRVELADNLSCISPVDYDLAITGVDYQEAYCQDTQDITVTVSNQGFQPITEATVELMCGAAVYTQEVSGLVYGQSVDITFEDVDVTGDDTFEVWVDSPLDEYPSNDLEVYPIEVLPGSLLTIDIYRDFWAGISWQLYDPDGEVVLSDSYSNGIDTLRYEACIFEGCYTVEAQDYAHDGFCTVDFNDDGVCDIGSDGIVGTVAGDTVFATGFGLSFSTWSATYCNTVTLCPYDLDGNGSIGSNDLTLLLTGYGCTSSCEYDFDGDGSVGIADLLIFFQAYGTSCDDEPETTYKSLDTYIPAGIYDLRGRMMSLPFDELPTGIYIIKTEDGVSKVYKTQ